MNMLNKNARQMTGPTTSLSGFEFDCTFCHLIDQAFAVKRVVDGQYRNWEGWQRDEFWFPRSLLQNLGGGRASIPYALVWGSENKEPLVLVTKDGVTQAHFTSVAQDPSDAARDPVDLLLAMMSSQNPISGHAMATPPDPMSTFPASPTSPRSKLLGVIMSRFAAKGSITALALVAVGAVGFLLGSGFPATLELGEAAIHSRMQRLDQREVELNGREEELSAERIRLETLTARAAGLPAEAARLASERSAVDAEQRELIESRTRLDTDRRRLDQDSVLLASRIAALETEQQTLATDRIRLDQREAELRQREETTAADRIRLDELTSRASGVLAEEHRLALERTALENGRRAVAYDRARLDADRRALRQGEDALVSGLSTLEVERREVASNRARLDNDRNALQQRVSELTSSRASFESERRTAVEAARSAAANMEAQAQVLARREFELRNLTQRVDQREAELRRREAAMAVERDRLDSLYQRAAAAQADVARVDAERSALAAERRALTEDQARLNAERTALQQREVRLHQRREEIVREWNTVVSQAPGNIFGALAVDDAATFWRVFNYNSLRSARQAVEQACQANSRVGNCRTFEFIRGCIAIARTTGNGWGVATGATRSEAGTNAVERCRSLPQNTGCRVTPEQAFCIGE
jgi:hypothetical protein